MIDRYGIEATRLHVLYKAPPEDELLWSEDGINGMTKWTKRCVSLAESVKNRDQTTLENDPSLDELEQAFNLTYSEVP